MTKAWETGTIEPKNITEQAVLAVLKQNPQISREEIAEKVSKTVRTVQRAPGSLTEKGYLRRNRETGVRSLFSYDKTVPVGRFRQALFFLSKSAESH